MPTSTVHVRLSEQAGGTRMELRSVFDSREQMEQPAGVGGSAGQE